MNESLIGLRSWVVKTGVMLGGLPQGLRMQVLALVWAGLPSQGPHSERQINELLKTQIASTASFIDVDHVELRRWLVDLGWLTRDGFGREYRRVATVDMASQQAALAATLLQTVGAPGAAAWVQAQRAAWQAEKDARRRSWQLQGGSSSAGDAA